MSLTFERTKKMPVVYIPPKSNVFPAIMYHDNEAQLVQNVIGLESVPSHLADKTTLKEWLAGQAAPAGWYDSIRELQLAVNALKNFQDATKEEIQEARRLLAPEGKDQMSQTDFMRALNSPDSNANDNTLKSLYQNIITGKRKLGEHKTMKMRALVAQAQLEKIASD